MDTLTALKTRRSIRRFTQKPVEREKVDAILECARFAPTAANRQPLKYGVVTGEKAEKVLEHLHWAGYLPDYRMEKEDLPGTLILIIGDLEISKDLQFSAGAAANQIMLSAHELGLANCCLGMSENARSAIMELLGVDSARFALICAVALGYSTQTSQAVDMVGSCKYWLDEHENFLVPKRTLQEILLDI